MNWKLIEPLIPPSFEVSTWCDHGRGWLHRERGGKLPGAIVSGGWIFMIHSDIELYRFVCMYIYIYNYIHIYSMYLSRHFSITCFYSVCFLLVQEAFHDTSTYHWSFNMHVLYLVWKHAKHATLAAWRFRFSVVVIRIVDLSWVMGLLLLDPCVTLRNAQLVLGEKSATSGCFIRF